MKRNKKILRVERELRGVISAMGDYSQHGLGRRLTPRVRMVIISLAEREILRLRLTQRQKDAILRTGILPKKYWDMYVEPSNTKEGLDGDGI